MSEEQHLSKTSFDQLNLHAALLDGLSDAGFERCTPIQARTLPLALDGLDVAGQAQTGTGKTAAFLLASMHRLLTKPVPVPAASAPTRPRTLIVAPTRELAVQIHADAKTLGAHTGLRLGLAFGGTGYVSQRETIAAGVDILIGTPGRLIDYFKQKVFDLRAVEVAVLDEADRMFDLGFIKDIRYLLRRMPAAPERVNMLFSATLSYRVLELAYEHMNDPQLIRIEAEHVTVDKVREKLYHVANNRKIGVLLHLMHDLSPQRSLIFVNTKREADRLEAYLNGNGQQAAVLSGDIPQKKRLQLLARLQSGELPTLVATDVAARGLHIADVSHVFNFDLPQDAQDYVHRIGRTARAGASGDAISLCCESYVYSLPAIEDYIGHKIPSEVANDDLWQKPVTPPGRGRRRGTRRDAKGKPPDRSRQPKRRSSHNTRGGQ